MQRSFKPRPTLDSQNTRNLYADIAWFGVLSGISGSFLSVFILRVGGSDFHVGLLSALPALVTFLASIPGSRLVEHENKPLSVLIVTAVLSRLGYLAIALSPFFLNSKRADVIVAIVGFMTVPTAVFNVAFTTMFGQAVKPLDRAHVVSIRNVWVGITSTAIAFIGGKFLDHVMFPINYQILFVIGFAASMASVYHLARIRLTAEPTMAATQAAASPGSVRDWVKMLSRSRSYVRFGLSSFFRVLPPVGSFDDAAWQRVWGLAGGLGAGGLSTGDHALAQRRVDHPGADSGRGDDVRLRADLFQPIAGSEPGTASPRLYRSLPHADQSRHVCQSFALDIPERRSGYPRSAARGRRDASSWRTLVWVPFSMQGWPCRETTWC